MLHSDTWVFDLPSLSWRRQPTTNDFIHPWKELKPSTEENRILGRAFASCTLYTDFSDGSKHLLMHGGEVHPDTAFGALLPAPDFSSFDTNQTAAEPFPLSMLNLDTWAWKHTFADEWVGYESDTPHLSAAHEAGRRRSRHRVYLGLLPSWYNATTTVQRSASTLSAEERVLADTLVLHGGLDVTLPYKFKHSALLPNTITLLHLGTKITQTRVIQPNSWEDAAGGQVGRDVSYTRLSNTKLRSLRGMAGATTALMPEHKLHIISGCIARTPSDESSDYWFENVNATGDLFSVALDLRVKQCNLGEHETPDVVDLQPMLQQFVRVVQRVQAGGAISSQCAVAFAAGEKVICNTTTALPSVSQEAFSMTNRFWLPLSKTFKVMQVVAGQVKLYPNLYLPVHAGTVVVPRVASLGSWKGPIGDRGPALAGKCSHGPL